MDDALDGNRAAAPEVVGRALQKRLQRRLELVHGVDVQQGVHRRSGPLDRGAVLDGEPLADDILQRELEAPFGQRVVTVDFEDVRTGVDLQVQRPLAAGLQRIARQRQLDVRIGPHVERQGDVHPAGGGLFLAVAAFEGQLAARHGVERVPPLGPLENHEVGVGDVRLARQRQEEVRIVVRRGRDVHVHHPLAARDAGVAGGVDPAVEGVVVGLGRIEHEHPLRRHAHVEGDVRQVRQIEVQIEPPAVALRVENRNAGGPEAVVADRHRRLRHRIGNLRVIDRRAEVPDTHLAPEVGLPALALQHQIGPGAPRRRGDHPREQRVEQRHVEAVGRQTGVIARPVGRIEPPHERIAPKTVGDGHPRPVAREVPARSETQRRRRNVIDPHAVEEDVGRDLGAAQHRFHRRRAVRAPFDRVAHAFGDLREGRKVEVAQREGHRIGAAARSHAVDEQLLLVVHHEEAVDRHVRRVDADPVREDLPRFLPPRDVRRKDAQTDHAAEVALLAQNARADADQSRDLAHGVREARRKLYAPLLRTARHREVRQVQHPGVEVLGRGIDRERIAAVRSIDTEACGQHPAAFDVFGRRLEREPVARRVEEQSQRRAVGDLQSRGHGVGHGVDIAYIDREQREVVGRGGHGSRSFLIGRPAAQHGQVAARAAAQVLEDGAVAGPRTERDVGEIRTQLDELACVGVLARHRDVRGLYLLVVVAVAGVGDPDAPVQVVERPPAGLGHDTCRELRDGVAAVDPEPRQVGVVQMHREVVTRNRIVEVHQSEKVEIEVGIAGRDAAVELAVAQAPVEPQRVIDIAVEAEAPDAPLHAGVGIAAPHHPVDPGRQGRVAQQLPVSRELPEAHVARRDLAPDRAAALFERAHPQVAGHVAPRRPGPQPHVERREQSPETGVQTHVARPVQHRGERRGKGLSGDAPRQVVGHRGRSPQVGNLEVEVRLPDVGKPPQRSRGRERRAVADAHPADLAREVRDDARHPGIYLTESQMPVAQTGSEVGHVVGRNLRIAQCGVDAHLAEKVPVVGPRVAGQRNVGNPDVRPGRHDPGLLEAQAALREIEPPGEVIQHEAALLARRQRGDGRIDGLSVDGEIVHPGVEPRQMQVRKVDSVGRIALLVPVEAKFHVLDRSALQREAELALPLPAGIRKARDDLFDVHFAVGHLVQMQSGVGDLPAAQLDAPAPQAEARDVGIQTPHVKERVAAVVLDVEILDAHLRKQPDVHPAHAHDRPQPLRDESGRTAHGIVLDGGNVEQQRKRHGKDYQQQNRRG